MSWNGTNRLTRTLGVAAAFALAACGDGTGPNGTGQMSVSLQESGTGSSAVMASVSSSESSSSAISLSSVSSVDIKLDRVEALPAARPDEEGAWVSLEVDGDVYVDLMDLGANGPITLADGTVPAGRYTNVRLYFSEASITTSEEITLEGGGTVAAGTYDLFIPSGMETGVKVVLGSVTVLEDETETVVLEIDTEASVQSVVYNEPEGFIMNSVLIQAGIGVGL